jgi:hypothetical protein
MKWIELCDRATKMQKIRNNDWFRKQREKIW